MRTINKTLIRAWYEKHGPAGVVKMALDTNLSFSFLDKFFRLVYGRTPKLATMLLIARGMKKPIDEVFPPKLPSKGDIAV